MNFNCVKKIDKDYIKHLYFVFDGDEKYPEFLSATNKKIIDKNPTFKKMENKLGKVYDFGFTQDDRSVNLSLVCLGDKSKFDNNKLREILYSNLSNLTGDVLVEFSDKCAENFNIIAEEIEHINYRFDKYLSEKNKEKLNVDVCTAAKKPTKLEGYELAKISNIVKDLINEHSEVMTPKRLSERAKEIGKEFGFNVKVFDEKSIEKFGMKAYLSVARAAHHRPYLIVMSYNGDAKSKYRYGLVGKGLTYDTGGLSLKSTDGMLTMKCDMGGSATMIGAMAAISKMKIKKNVVAVVAACENSIGPNAYRPGDVVETMNGKTIEINNTDAEGRVTLADALTYIIRKEKVDEIIDAATLTGAIMIALGEDLTGLFTNDDKFADEFMKNSKEWKEEFWKMPMLDSFKRYLKSEIADMQNTGGRMGGSISAAKFLEEFVENKKWIHLDIAGTAFSSGSKYYKKGATGEVFRTIYSYIKNNKN